MCGLIVIVLNYKLADSNNSLFTIYFQIFLRSQHNNNKST